MPEPEIIDFQSSIFEANLTRRSFIKKSFLGTASLYALASIPLSTASYAKDPILQTFSPKEMAVLKAAAEAFFPAGGAIPYSATEAEVPRFLDGHFSSTDPETKNMLKMLLSAMEVAPIFFLFSFKRFSNLSIPDRQKFLLGLEKSRWFIKKFLFVGLKIPCVLAYYANEKVQKSIGYESWCAT